MKLNSFFAYSAGLAGLALLAAACGGETAAVPEAVESAAVPEVVESAAVPEAGETATPEAVETEQARVPVEERVPAEEVVAEVEEVVAEVEPEVEVVKTADTTITDEEVPDNEYGKLVGLTSRGQEIRVNEEGQRFVDGFPIDDSQNPENIDRLETEGATPPTQEQIDKYFFERKHPGKKRCDVPGGGYTAVEPDKECP